MSASDPRKRILTTVRPEPVEGRVSTSSTRTGLKTVPQKHLFCKISSGKKNRTIWLAAWVFGLVFGICGVEAAADGLTGQTEGEAFKQYLLVTVAVSASQELSLSSANIRAIIHDNLDPRLLKGIIQTSGSDFRFTLPTQTTDAQIALLRLAYPDAKTALAMQGKLAAKGGYFQHTKILTRFSSVPIGSELVITFTENSGDERVVKLVDRFPGFLQERYSTRNPP